MPSLQARLLRPLLRVQRAYQGRMATAPIERLVKFRRRSDAITARLIRMPRGVAVEPETVAGVNGTWISHESAAADPVVIFIHGGSIFFGLTPAHRRAVALIARSAGVRVFAIQYRLNPGNPYPNAHDDCFAVYKVLGPLSTPIKADQGGLFAWLITTAYAGGVASTVPISPDGLKLYSTTDYDGVMVLRVPDLKPVAKLAAGFNSNEVWVSGDGRTIYVISDDAKHLLVMGSDGSHQKTVTLPNPATGFVAS